MGAALAKFSEGESKLKRLKVFNSKNNYDLTDEASHFAYSVWENLPYVALVEIYRYLSPRDKFNLSLTCKAWNQALYTPEIWPKATFHFNGRDDWRALRFNSTLSTGLRHLNIECRDTAQSWKRYTAFESTTNLYTFIESIINNKNCRLLTLKLTNMARLTRWLNWSSHHDVVKVLGDILSTQTTLQVLDLSNARFNAVQGIDILSKMARSCGSTLTKLIITELVPDFVPICMATQLVAFTKLTELSLSYENLSDELLNALADSGSLKRMNVTARSRMALTHPSSKSWEQLKMSCPALEAQFFINECLGFIGVLLSILKPGIPLVDLDFNWKDMRIVWKDICCHIATHFKNHLRHLNIKIYNERVKGSYLIVIIKSCLLLEEISIIDVNGHISDLETRIGSSVRKILASRPASCLHKVALNGVDLDLKPTWESFLVHWVRNRFRRL